MIDFENDDAFSLTTLTLAMNEDKQVPGMLNNSGMFQEEGISTLTAQIEKDGNTLALVEASERGAPAKPVHGSKRILLPFNTIHLPQQAVIKADEVNGVREFGAENQAQTVAGVVAKRVTTMRYNLDATIEHLKVGALTGKVLDANGSDVLLDVYARFGLTQTEFGMVLDVTTTEITGKCRALEDLIEDEMDGIGFTSIKVYCGRNFYNELVGHANVKKAYELWNNGQFNRDKNNEGFTFGEIEWVKYRGQVGGSRFIGDDDAYAVAVGAPNLFIGRFSPADYMETANQVGLPYYAKAEAMKFNKGVELESQSNPLYLCTKPQAVIKLRKGA